MGTTTSFEKIKKSTAYTDAIKAGYQIFLAADCQYVYLSAKKGGYTTPICEISQVFGSNVIETFLNRQLIELKNRLNNG